MAASLTDAEIEAYLKKILLSPNKPLTSNAEENATGHKKQRQRNKSKSHGDETKMTPSKVSQQGQGHNRSQHHGSNNTGKNKAEPRPECSHSNNSARQQNPKGNNDLKQPAPKMTGSELLQKCALGGSSSGGGSQEKAGLPKKKSACSEKSSDEAANVSESGKSSHGKSKSAQQEEVGVLLKPKKKKKKKPKSADWKKIDPTKRDVEKSADQNDKPDAKMQKSKKAQDSTNINSNNDSSDAGGKKKNKKRKKPSNKSDAELSNCSDNTVSQKPTANLDSKSNISAEIDDAEAADQQEFFATDKELKELEQELIFPLRKKSQRFPMAKFYCRLCEYHCDNVKICERHIKDTRP